MTTEPEPLLRLNSEDPLSKWGFNDGDEPDDFWDWREIHSEPDVDWHATLRRLVRKHLLPKLDQRVEAVDIDTIHNPIRAEKVNGVEIEWTRGNANARLTPEYVEVPYDEVLRVAREATS